MSYLAQNYENREGSSNFRHPTSNFQLFFNGNLRQFLFVEEKKKPLKMCFPERSCDRDGRYLTISVKRTTSTKIKKLNIAPSFINMNLFELENSHFMPLIADVGSNLHDHKNSPAPLSSLIV